MTKFDLLRNNQRESNFAFINNLIIKLIIFVLWPFGAFLLSLKNMASRSSYVIYFLFGILFCWNFNPRDAVYTDDLAYIMQRFINNNISTNDFFHEVKLYFTFSPDSAKELYEIFLNWFTRLFSDNPHLFFAIAAIPFLFFMLKSMKNITDDIKFKQSIGCFVILLLFVLPRDIITVQNPRFATGLWLVVYATIMFFKNNTKTWKYAVLILLSPLFHSAFWAYVIIFIFILLVINYYGFAKVLFYVSIPFAFISTTLFSTLIYDFGSYFPFLEEWTKGYMSESSYNKFILNQGASGYYWVSNIFDVLKKITYLCIPLYIIKTKNSLIDYQNYRLFFNYYIIFFAIVNFLQSVPVLGERFYMIVRIISILLWFKIVYTSNKNIFQYLILFACSWDIFLRYFYHGALYRCVPYDIFYQNLIYLVCNYWGVNNIGFLNFLR